MSQTTNGEQTIEQTPRLPALSAGNRVQAIVPTDFEGAWRIAIAVCKASMAPKGIDKPEQAMIAIMHGLEVGLTPMAALQSIALINGRPAIWGDGAIGLVRGSGLLEWMKETIEGSGETMKAICVVQRRGEPEPIRSEFTVADAKRAGLWGKSGPWTQYPKRMLQHRARGFALRDGFADVLRGLHIAEEMEDVREMRDVTPPPPPPPPPPPGDDDPPHDPETGELHDEPAETPPEPEPERDAIDEALDVPVDGDGPTKAEQIHDAYEAGRRARQRGIARKAVPTEFREKGREDEHDAWVKGWADEDQGVEAA